MNLKQEVKQSKIFGREISQSRQGLPLPLVLVVFFVLQICASVGITGYLSFRNGQKAVNALTNDLQEEVSDRVSLHLDHYIETAVAVNQINADVVKLGLLNLNDYKTAGLYHWKQLQVFKNVGYISYALPTGEYAGAGRWLEDGRLTIDELSANTNWEAYDYATDEQGNRTEIIDDTPYHPLSESWYTETVKQGKPIWTEVYAWDGHSDILSVPVNYPLYDHNGKLLAVLSVDLLLKGISDFLRSFDISPSAEVFIVERNGLIIASSSLEQPYKIVGEKAQRINVHNSNDPLIKATAKYLQASFGNFNRIVDRQKLDFTINGDRHFARVTPWKDKLGLDWLVVVVMPESDFMAEINANTRSTILLCLTSLLVAILLGIITSRWITEPIRRLSHASQAIASGDFEQTVSITGIKELRVLADSFAIREIGKLATSFNSMATQLKALFAELEAKNEERIRLAVAHERQLNQFLDALPIGVTVHNPDSSIFYLNKMAKQLLQLDIGKDDDRNQLVSAYQFYQVGTNTPYSTEKLPIVLALQGESVRTEDLELHLNETIIPLEVLGTPIWNEQHQIEFAITAFQDITKRKQAEQILADYSHQLEQEVNQRTAELAHMNVQLQQEVQERKLTEQKLQLANQKLQQLATIDGLTQVANRRYFDLYLQQEWQRLKREKQFLSLILLDLDYFKRYNDYYGHQAGDTCLQAIAQAAKESVLRPADLVARYGGEEFAVILPNTEQQGAAVVAQNIQQTIQALEIPHVRSEVSMIVSVSMGIASLIPTASSSPELLISQADRALYTAKQQGRDRYSLSP